MRLPCMSRAHALRAGLKLLQTGAEAEERRARTRRSMSTPCRVRQSMRTRRVQKRKGAGGGACALRGCSPSTHACAGQARLRSGGMPARCAAARASRPCANWLARLAAGAERRDQAAQPEPAHPVRTAVKAGGREGSAASWRQQVLAVHRRRMPERGAHPDSSRASELTDRGTRNGEQQCWAAQGSDRGMRCGQRFRAHCQARLHRHGSQQPLEGAKQQCRSFSASCLCAIEQISSC